MRERTGRIQRGFVVQAICQIVLIIKLIIKSNYIGEDNTCNNPTRSIITALSLKQFSCLNFPNFL